MHKTSIILFLLLVWKINGENLEENGSDVEATDRIYDVFKISIERAPFYVQVLKNENYYCGGTILSQQVVLTAGHCSETPGSYYVIVGSARKFHGTRLGVNKVVLHPNYGHPLRIIYNDVALLFLKKQLKFSTQIQPIVIPNAKTQLVAEGTQLLVVGLGKLRNMTMAFWLRGIYLPMINQDWCNRYITKRTNDVKFLSTQFCLGNLTIEGYSACKGDSGGPAIYNGIQYGLVSWGTDCGKKNVPMIYTNLVTLNGWIRKQVRDLRIPIA